MKNKKYVFTLIELLVVIAILASMLLPVSQWQSYTGEMVPRAWQSILLPIRTKDFLTTKRHEQARKFSCLFVWFVVKNYSSWRMSFLYASSPTAWRKVKNAPSIVPRIPGMIA